MTAAISTATTWNEYYESHREIYLKIIQARWALGNASFAHHIHHPAVPDASGALIRVVNWATYSQVTGEGLAAFMQAFSGLIEREPQRKRTRYCLFTRKVEAIDPDRVGDLIKSGVDFCVDSFEGALSYPEEFGAIDSINALFASDHNLIVDRRILATSTNASGEQLEILRPLALERAQSAKRSVIPGVLRNLCIDSSIILTAARCDLEPRWVTEHIGGRAGLAATVAQERARDSGWPDGTRRFFETIISEAPPEREVYIVKPGDILSRIVRQKYGLSFPEVWPLIRAMNPGLDPDKIFPDQKIALPSMS